MTDEYVERATTLESNDAPSGNRQDAVESYREFYKRLSLLNSLDWNGKWRDERRETVKNRVAIVDAIGSTLELTDFQQDRAHRFFDRLPDSYNKAYSTALLAVCVCGLSGRLDGRDYHPNNVHPNTDAGGEFGEIVEDLGVEYPTFYTCWSRVERELL